MSNLPHEPLKVPNNTLILPQFIQELRRILRGSFKSLQGNLQCDPRELTKSIGLLHRPGSIPGMSCDQPQAEAVSLEQTADFILKIYIRPVVAEIFPLSLGFKFRPDVSENFYISFFRPSSMEGRLQWDVFFI
jgi:hypothetical protein